MADCMPNLKSPAAKTMENKCVNLKRIKEMVASGFTASEIVKELNIAMCVVWDRTQKLGLIRKLRANEAKHAFEVFRKCFENEAGQ